MLSIASPIKTERLVVRPFTADDLDDLYAIQSRPDVVRYLYWNVRTRDEVRQVLQLKAQQTALAQEGDRLSLAVALPAADGTCARVIGEISLGWRSVEHRQGEIGFFLHPEYQGRGYMTEAAKAILDLAFDELGLHRVYGRCDALNIPSASLMSRLGMRQEAHFVHDEIFKGQWGECLVFAILEDEWRAKRRP